MESRWKEKFRLCFGGTFWYSTSLEEPTADSTCEKFGGGLQFVLINSDT